MAGFKEWLQRLRRPSSSTATHTPASIEKTITDALARAGLMPQAKTPQQADSIFRPAHNADENAGRFFWCDSDKNAGALRYKLYVPQSYAGSAAKVPLIVMLHGCTQDPDDFALGTQMNALAESAAALVAYPQQTAQANPQKCWNWFRPEDQMRGAGEPEHIARIVRQIIADYRIDPRRVFVAGMSAGGAMAEILARCYPDLFAAVAVHSGLPYRCANNVVSALSVMRDAASAHAQPARSPLAMPTLVIRGDDDKTVDPANSEAIVDQAARDWPADDQLTREATTSTTAGGRATTCTTFRNRGGRVVIESWNVSGGGHHWFGGDARGSHTDSSGPSASELVRQFFDDQADD
jgi:poly(hydroxyalkanoate) depolymerase family esterase